MCQYVSSSTFPVPVSQPCDSFPCQNQGSCSYYLGQIYCICQQGYSGPYCERSTFIVVCFWFVVGVTSVKPISHNIPLNHKISKFMT